MWYGVGVEKLLVFYVLIALWQNSRDGRRENLPREATDPLSEVTLQNFLFHRWLQGSFLLLIIIIYAKHTVPSLFCCSEIRDFLTQEIRVGNFLAPTKKDTKNGRNSSNSGRVVGKLEMPCRAGRRNKQRQPPTTNEQQTLSRRRHQLQRIA
jgi:hypothetical protein